MPRGRALGSGRLWKRGPQWVLDFRDAQGARHQHALGTDKRVAERRQLEIINRRNMELDGLGASEGLHLFLGDIARDYLADLKVRATARHHRLATDRVRQALGVLGPLRVRDLRIAEVLNLRNGLVREGSSHRTANLRADTLKAMLNWAVAAGLVAANPLARLKRLPERAEHQRCRRRALSEEEIARLLAASEHDDRENALAARLCAKARVPQTPLWRALLMTGARWGELRLATWGDVDLRAAQILLRAENTKSRKQRAIPLAEEVVSDLRKLRAAHQAVLGHIPTVAELVFLSPEGKPWRAVSCNQNRLLARLLERAGIPKLDHEGRKIDIHALRHTFASRLARAGVSLVQAQRLLGHSDPKLTAQIYTHLAAEDLRGAIEAIRPRAQQESRERIAT